MKLLNIETWARKEQYLLFSRMDYPQFNICTNVDVSNLYDFVNKNGLSFYIAMVYLSSKAANVVESFRYRINGDKIIVHDTVHPSFTVLSDTDAFSFCQVQYKDCFLDFHRESKTKIGDLKNKVCLEDEPGRDDLLFITCIPWISFTSIVHPVDLKSGDSIPRLSWGKYYRDGNELKLPYSVQVNHSLMDGCHVGLFLKVLQEMLDKPQDLLEISLI